MIQPKIFAIRAQVVGDGRLKEIAGNITLVITPTSWRPALPVAQRESRLDVAVGFPGGQDPGNPILKRCFHEVPGFDYFLIALWIDHEGNTDRLNRVINPGIGEHVASVRSMRLASQLVGGVNEVVDTAFLQVRVGNLINAMGNPVHDQGFRSVAPKRTVDRVALSID